MTRNLIITMAFVCLAPCPAFAKIILAENGRAKATIYVKQRLMDDAKKAPEPVSIWRKRDAEANRRRLRESVKDLAAILQRITGAKFDIRTSVPRFAADHVPILIGKMAANRFGKPKKSYPYAQGFRIVVSDKGVGLIGESDLAVSYAIYTLLDDIGCRWYIPSAMGETLPKMKTLALRERDVSSGPYTTYRGMWYVDNDFARRNRMGGMELAAGHALEGTVPKELRKTNPEIRAVIDGKPHARKVKWTHPLVAKGIADVFLARLRKDPSIPTFSLSPDDGIGWDESDDRKHDAGDFDPAVQMVSKTDRLMVLANRVAAKVAAKYPHVRIGILAYADYTRPPLREKVHPNVVPQIAPITFTRAHPMTDDGEPNNKSLRYLVEGWGKKAKQVSYYFYGFNLAEPSGPNPYITRWGTDLPITYKNNCKFWQPETITNFETTMHAHYLGQRLAWDPNQKPQAIIDELNEKFYGNAAKEMAAYWSHIDGIWVKTPEYSGCGFGHLRRFTVQRMIEARQLMNKALAAARTPAEKFRVGMAIDSLTQFRLFMKLRRDLASGRFRNLAKDAKRYRKQLVALCDKYESQYAFGRMGWTRGDSLYGRYFGSFYQRTYDDAARIADSLGKRSRLLRRWRYRIDKDNKGEKAGWSRPAFDDSKWKATDVCQQTWSTLGYHNYMGALWYRQKVNVPATSKQKLNLWIGATDGSVKVFVNGKHVPYVDPKGKKLDEFRGYCQPASFDVTKFIRAGENNIALLCTRRFLNELGTGGLLAPVVLYSDRK